MTCYQSESLHGSPRKGTGLWGWISVWLSLLLAAPLGSAQEAVNRPDESNAIVVRRDVSSILGADRLDRAKIDYDRLLQTERIPGALRTLDRGQVSESSKLSEQLDQASLKQAKQIVDPRDRSLALSQVAEALILNIEYNAQAPEKTDREYQISSEALAEAIRSSVEVENDAEANLALNRAIIVLVNLAESQINTANSASFGEEDLFSQLTPPAADPLDLDLDPELDRQNSDRESSSDEPNADSDPLKSPEYWVAQAKQTWILAANAATQVRGSTRYNEELYQVVLRIAESSREIINDTLSTNQGYSNLFSNTIDIDDPLLDLEEPNRPLADDPLEREPAISAEETRDQESDKTLKRLADDLLVLSVDLAQQMTRPVFRDDVLIQVVNAAGRSEQFERALLIAEGIPDPSSRGNALITLADILARDRYDDAATVVFQKAVSSFSEVAQTDKRDIGLGVLLNSLINTARFKDARLCAPLASSPRRQLIAYAAIARAQGQRGLIDEAADWINQIDEELRPRLRLALLRGIAEALEDERNRQSDFSLEFDEGLNPISDRP